MLCFPIWLVLGLAGAVLAYQKMPPARDGAEQIKFAVLKPVMLILCVILGPIGLVMMLVTPAMKICPYCRTQIRRNATVCRACTRNV